jgi:threonylcarbamoyladenosine tRNA methylthiotransferase MtaB
MAEIKELDFRFRGNNKGGGNNNVRVCVLNTCAVTATAEAKSRKLIRRFIRENPGSRLIVTGCLAQAKPDEVRKLLRKEDMVVGNKEKGGIAEMIGKLEIASLSPARTGRGSSRYDKKDGSPRTRAFVKIQDGCNNFCSYCIVPFLRSEMWSKPLEDVDREVRELVSNGYQEVVLTGINLGKYFFTQKTQRINLVNLIEQLIKIEGIERIRLSSIELEDVSDGLIDLIAKNPVICPHLHIPLQSGSDRVIKLMKRHYTSGDFIKRVDLLKSRIKNPAITTDIIVGFPGESEDDFRQTLAVCKDAGFSKIHIFPFSPRPGTAASGMKEVVKRDIIKKRYNILNNLASELSLKYKQLFLGQEADVLAEEKSEGFTDRYIKVRIKPNGKVKPNQIIRVKVTGIKPEWVNGQIVRSR